MSTHSRNKSIWIILSAVAAAAVAFFIIKSHMLNAPEKAVYSSLSEIRELDSDSAESLFLSSAKGAQGTSFSTIGDEGKEAIRLFYSGFSFRITGSRTEGDSAQVDVRATMTDARWLASQIRRKQLSAAYSSGQGKSASGQAEDDFFPLMKEILGKGNVPKTEADETLSVTYGRDGWYVNSDDALKHLLGSDLSDALKDPYLLSPEDVVNVYLSRYSSMTPQQWADDLQSTDLFQTASTNVSSLNQTFFEKIAELYSYRIDEVHTEDNSSQAAVTITSIDMTKVLSAYRKKLIEYAKSIESLTADKASQADASASMLQEALKENASPKECQVTILLENDGTSWQITNTSGLTNALLGDISSAVESFNKNE